MFNSIWGDLLTICSTSGNGQRLMMAMVRDYGLYKIGQIEMKKKKKKRKYMYIKYKRRKLQQNKKKER